MTNKELAKAIRNAIKNYLGYTSRDISVRVSDCGYSTSVKITIKNPHIQKSKVESLVKRFESIDRCEITGEILEGGNTYIFTQYDYGVFDEVKKPYEEKAKKIMLHCPEVFEISKDLYLQRVDGYYQIRQQGEKSAVFRFGSPSELAELLYKFYEFETIEA